MTRRGFCSCRGEKQEPACAAHPVMLGEGDGELSLGEAGSAAACAAPDAPVLAATWPMARTRRWPRAPAGRSTAGPGWRRRCRASARTTRTTRTSTRTKRRTEPAAGERPPCPVLPEELSDLRAQGASDRPPAVLRGRPMSACV